MERALSRRSFGRSPMRQSCPEARQLFVTSSFWRAAKVPTKSFLHTLLEVRSPSWSPATGPAADAV